MVYGLATRERINYCRCFISRKDYELKLTALAVHEFDANSPVGWSCMCNGSRQNVMQLCLGEKNFSITIIFYWILNF